MAGAAAAISQLRCYSAVHRSLHLHRRSLPCPSLRFSNSKLSVVMSLERHGTGTSGSETKNTLSYAADASKLHVEEKQKSYLTKEDHDAEKIGSGESIQEGGSQQKRTAKIHDFCLGIPFGGFVLTGGIIGFLFSRSPATLSSGVLFGGALLFLSTLSLKVWRQGKSSLPFILGQAALSGILIWKNFQSYSLAKKIFPTGFSAILSSAMLCFYLYVLISGGNPPPKKLKQSASNE
ncbi:protein FATTY ACID EXPORT 1, chloroplastic [Gastrolobium bilobum]|uniref:protein FATTY ACID EXPORT 1, chloroplastic n=1 Tax=Gastrolobium bilobum TaxID=150636 RepID=UPI002AAF287A|nr:protein FATTY ACID EXPORT 1, chloroplastic [Gastrolobium bilobum]